MQRVKARLKEAPTPPPDVFAGPSSGSTASADGGGVGSGETCPEVAPFGLQLQGLSSAEAERALRMVGSNEIAREQPRSNWRIVMGVLKEPMFLLLIGAAVLYSLLGSPEEAGMLAIFIVAIICLTIYEERKTEHALSALKRLSCPRALAIRDGVRKYVPGANLVPGDLLIICEGDRVPADGIALDALSLSVDESVLTGESVPVRKLAPELDVREIMQLPMVSPSSHCAGQDTPYVFSGTLVVQGRALVVVKCTGPSTELGRIGKSLADVRVEKSPLERETRTLVVRMLAIGMSLCGVVFVLSGVMSEEPSLTTRWVNAMLRGISLAMALLPEEFGVVLSVFVAMGAWRLAKKKVLCRRNAAIESLGCASVLCTDKTGTLTENRMAVESLYAANGGLWCDLTPGRCPDEVFRELVEVAVLSSQRDPFDPMEVALLELAQRDPDWLEQLHGSWEVLREYPLSRHTLAISRVCRSMGVDNEVPRCLVACKGAPETIIDLCHLGCLCSHQAVCPPASGAAEGTLTVGPNAGAPLSVPLAVSVIQHVERMTSDGLRVLGVARASLPSGQMDAQALPADQRAFAFEFLGLVGLRDPLRPDVPGAVHECQQAGIRVVMVTGDHPNTAVRIARECGISGCGEVITGPELSEMSVGELARRVLSCNIFARVVPEQKLKLVQAFKDAGFVTAMTGDGVNDAPALKAAHVGIAMGERGTDVAREAAHLVLLDDAFPSIVAACRLGRRIFDNLCKAMAYIIAVHVPFIGLSLLPLLFRWPTLLEPVHIVFAELVIDPACSVVFEMEPEEPVSMRRPPRRSGQSMVTLRNFLLALTTGSVILFAALLLFWVNHSAMTSWGSQHVLFSHHHHLHQHLHGLQDEHFIAMSFGCIIIGNLGCILTFRSFTESVRFTIRRPNRAVWIIVPTTLVALFATIFVPGLNDLFHFLPLPMHQIFEFVVAGLVGPALFEMYKWNWRRQHPEYRQMRAAAAAEEAAGQCRAALALGPSACKPASMATRSPSGHDGGRVSSSARPEVVVVPV